MLGLTCESPEQVIRLSRSCINDVDAIGRTGLHWAVCQGNLGMAEQLLRCGADPDVSDRDAKTPLHLASSLGYLGVTDTLIRAGANLEAKDSLLQTPLHIAAMRNQVPTVARLIKAGATVDSRSGIGETPLLSACVSDSIGSIEMLCSFGADLEAKCNLGCSALGRGIKMNRHQTVKLLHERGAKVDAVRQDQRSILHLIAQATDKAMMSLLVNSGIRGFDANATDSNGLTALQHLQLRDDADELFDIFAQVCETGETSVPMTQEEMYFDALESQL